MFNKSTLNRKTYNADFRVYISGIASAQVSTSAKTKAKLTLFSSVSIQSNSVAKNNGRFTLKGSANAVLNTQAKPKVIIPISSTIQNTAKSTAKYYRKISVKLQSVTVVKTVGNINIFRWVINPVTSVNWDEENAISANWHGVENYSGSWQGDPLPFQPWGEGEKLRTTWDDNDNSESVNWNGINISKVVWGDK